MQKEMLIFKKQNLKDLVQNVGFETGSARCIISKGKIILLEIPLCIAMMKNKNDSILILHLAVLLMGVEILSLKWWKISKAGSGSALEKKQGWQYQNQEEDSGLTSTS